LKLVIQIACPNEEATLLATLAELPRRRDRSDLIVHSQGFEEFETSLRRPRLRWTQAMGAPRQGATS